ncbi:MAG: SusC/RagA family TonB-linked outer membrane protein, partial [Sphingobacteriaceae bacterium]
MRKLLASFVALLLFIANVYGQTQTVTGVVRDAQGNPVPFATVTESGTRNAAVADANGNYSIKIKPNAKLNVTAAGYTPQNGSSGGNIVLTRNDNGLQEVVVTTALGIKRQSKELGYAATSISNRTLTQAKSVNVQQALNGKISGLSITTTNSGVFENAKINIRGIRSLT